MTISVALVDDEAMIRVGLRMVLSGESDIRVVGEAADGVEALDLVARTRPDVVLIDVRMPRMDGLEAARRLVREHPDSKVIVLTTFDEDEHVASALRAGVSGFLLKVAPPEHLIEAVRTVAGRRRPAGPCGHPEGDRGVRRAAGSEPGDEPGGRAGVAHHPGDRRVEAAGAGLDEHPDRDPALPGRGDRQDAPVPDPDEAQRDHPRPGGRLRLRERARPPRDRNDRVPWVSGGPWGRPGSC
ncbi:response regulator [Nonomuraea dietziae]|uniref:response regulator n=1 Tax=Nonomuraea dietziae TaxID=65515 RepID=UPI003CD0C1AD